MNSKNLIIIGLLLFTLTLFGQNNSGKAIYNVTRIAKEAQDMAVMYGGEIQKSLEDILDSDFEVLFKNSQLLYKREKKMIVRKTGIVINFADIDVMGNDSLFSNLKSKKFIHKRLFNGEKMYMIEDYLPNIKWQIHNDVKIINGFKCRKATALVKANDFFGEDTKIIAWFTENKTIVFPDKFFGLNGTIVELTTGTIIYKLKSLEFKSDIKISVPKIESSISQKKLMEFVKSVS